MVEKSHDLHGGETNPCSYKSVCKNCKTVDLEDRPKTCVSLECEEYTPCIKCGRNKSLDENELCQFCLSKKKEPIITRNEKGNAVVVDREEKKKNKEKVYSVNKSSEEESKKDDDEETGVREVDIAITPPGTPPANYSDTEKKYYLTQWEQYEGYYTDPTVYAICHQIIIIEIELNWLTSFMINTRGEYTEVLEKRQTALITNMERLRKQLPEKEALELSDDEKSLAHIYKEYTKEKEKKTKLGTRMPLSAEALALNPILTFPLDLPEIFKRMGYKTEDIKDITDRLINNGSVPENPIDFAEMVGFSPREEYAEVDETEQDTSTEDLMVD